MKEWQIGLLAGLLAAISFILVDLLFMFPRVVDLGIGFVFTLTGTFIGNKLLNDRKKRSSQET